MPYISVMTSATKSQTADLHFWTMMHREGGMMMSKQAKSCLVRQRSEVTAMGSDTMI